MLLHWCALPGFWTRPNYEAPVDFRFKLELVQGLTSSEWGYLLVSGWKLALGQQNSWYENTFLSKAVKINDNFTLSVIS